MIRKKEVGKRLTNTFLLQGFLCRKNEGQHCNQSGVLQSYFTVSAEYASNGSRDCAASPVPCWGWMLLAKDSQGTFRWRFIHSFLEQRIEKKSKREGRERSQCKGGNEEHSKRGSKYRLDSGVLTRIWKKKKKLAKGGPVTRNQVC